MGIINEGKLIPSKEAVYVSPMFGTSSNIIKAITDVNINDESLYNVLVISIKVLLSKDFIDNNLEVVKNNFCTVKVLNTVSRIVSNLGLEVESIGVLNQIFYSYMKAADADENVSNVMRSISLMVNSHYANSLIKFLPEKQASDLSILRCSSSNDLACTKRINSYLLNMVDSEDENSLMLIVSIYDVLFPSLTALVEGTMFDVKNRSLFTQNQNEVYGLEGLALLSILELQPISIISAVLKNYGIDRAFRKDIPVRFSFNSISQTDYPRICSAKASLLGVVEVP